jgi:cysteine-rich repeat protein
VTAPQFVHARTGGECGITGGFVYRGCALPNLLGAYFYSDSCTNSVRSFRWEGGTITDLQDWTADLVPNQGSLTSVVSFGEDATGELYFVDDSGSVFRMVPRSGTDCGNGAIDPGEQCDDGNTDPGDGCDPFCRIEPGPPNDRCFNALPLEDETILFDTAGALTDGPDEVVACDSESIVNIIGSDVWYCHTASCSGTATVDLCTSGFDTIVAVYEGCSCPSAASAIGCNDNACFVQSTLNFPVTACSSYLIRVGGFVGDQGAGSLTLSCSPDPITNDCNLNMDDAVDIACGVESDTNSNLIPDSCETDGDPIRGGRLYDRWWSQIAASEPASDHPLWAYRPDLVSNPATGGTTWRCKECHGWDYKGVAGQYGAGPHRTGFGGILQSDLSAPDMFDLLKSPPSNGGGPGILNGHDYGTVLSDGSSTICGLQLLGPSRR